MSPRHLPGTQPSVVPLGDGDLPLNPFDRALRGGLSPGRGGSSATLALSAAMRSTGGIPARKKAASSDTVLNPLRPSEIRPGPGHGIICGRPDWSSVEELAHIIPTNKNTSSNSIVFSSYLLPILHLYNAKDDQLDFCKWFDVNLCPVLNYLSIDDSFMNPQYLYILFLEKKLDD
ncbi:hypothetical protein AGLY_012411 [Aphis glycines]|uniref:Uncharacterized protein n=1 Tax=Aphis glycines TaxID=307491 RepID=A0A6G0TA61_APHGL|nr:hypothetical protein AGLY_012411 [Aphis glycines]